MPFKGAECLQEHLGASLASVRLLTSVGYHPYPLAGAAYKLAYILEGSFIPSTGVFSWLLGLVGFYCLDDTYMKF